MLYVKKLTLLLSDAAPKVKDCRTQFDFLI